MTEAYKGGIILENSNATIEADNIASTTLTGNLYAETMGGLSENSLMKKLTEASKLPTLEFLIVFIDKILANYCKTNNSSKVSLNAIDAPFDAKDALNGGYMYNENGNYNNNAYDIDINTALLMAEKLTNEIKNVNISGNMTSDRNTDIHLTNVRFSGDVSGLNFTSYSGSGIIDFAKVGPKTVYGTDAKIVIGGIKNNNSEKNIRGYVVDLFSVSKTLLKNVRVDDSCVNTIYSNGTFTGTALPDVNFKQGSSASTNRAWERKGRDENVPNSELISKLDVKAKANNPLLQKLLDENCPVYG